MKKIFLFILFIYFSNLNLYGHCHRVKCDSSVLSNTMILQSKIIMKFIPINMKIQNIQNNYIKYNTALKELNLAYDLNLKLKKEYLLILKNIKFEQDKQIQIKSLKR